MIELLVHIIKRDIITYSYNKMYFYNFNTYQANLNYAGYSNWFLKCQNYLQALLVISFLHNFNFQQNYF